MDKASVYGTGDCRFESYQGQFVSSFLLIEKKLAQAVKLPPVRIELTTLGL